jgi:hypothetical protein
MKNSHIEARHLSTVNTLLEVRILSYTEHISATTTRICTAAHPKLNIIISDPVVDAQMQNAAAGISAASVQPALAMIESVTHKDYYVKMAKAWALSVFYHHAPEKVERILSREHDSFVYDKTLQKIIESNRSDAALREKIRKLRKQ